MNNTAEDLIELDRERIVRPVFAVGTSRGVIFESGKGIILKDTDGNEYIDGASQLVCVNLGYGRREIIDAIKAQLEKLQYGTLFFGFGNKAVVEYADAFAGITPGNLNHFMFTCGGSESNEVAIRIARMYQSIRGKRKYKIVSLFDSYHGVTTKTAAATGTGKGYFEAGEIPTAGHIYVPSYFCYRCMLGKEYPSCDTACAGFLCDTIERAGRDLIAAVIAEPVMGVGGLIPPPPEYWPKVRKICDDLDVLLIDDEVMCGFCRTGEMFGVQNWGVIPDIMTTAKAISNSYIPFGAVAFSDAIYEALKEAKTGVNGFTFGGHPVGAAAALAALNIYVKEEMAVRVRKISKYTMERLTTDFASLPYVDNINGLGLMIGMNIVADKKTKTPFELSRNVVGAIQNQALEKGLWIRVCSQATTASDRVMFAPPLVITEAETDRALDILYSILSKIKQG